LVVEAGEASRGLQIHVKELETQITDEENNVIQGNFGGNTEDAPVAIAA
jgi:hypothetical protein